MDEKQRNIQLACSIAGFVALVICFILTIVGSTTVLLALRILFSGIAAIAYAIKMGAEILNDDFYVGSLFLTAVCLLNLVVTAYQL